MSIGSAITIKTPTEMIVCIAKDTTASKAGPIMKKTIPVRMQPTNGSIWNEDLSLDIAATRMKNPYPTAANASASENKTANAS